MVTARRSDGVWSRAGEFNGDGKARVEGVEEVAQEQDLQDILVLLNEAMQKKTLCACSIKADLSSSGFEKKFISSSGFAITSL